MVTPEQPGDDHATHRITCNGALVVLAVACLGLAAAPALAEDWPHWRGPAMNGSSPETGLPETFSKTENVVWVAALPGRGYATPIISGDRVFVTSVAKQERELLALCLDRKEGKVLWQKVIGPAGDLLLKRNTMATCSPTTDGKTAYFLYGSGDLAAFDFDGKELWRRALQKDHGEWAVNYGYASSPLLYKGRLFVLVLQNDKAFPVEDATRREHKVSYLLAIDPATGKDLWKHIRPTDAWGLGQETYSSPMPYEPGGKGQVVVLGGDYVTGHDAETGQELWRWGCYNPKSLKWYRTVASPLVVDDLVIAPTPLHGPMYALRGGEGAIPFDRRAWVRETADLVPDCATPLCYKGLVYFLEDDKQKIVCIEPKTGAEKWRGELGGNAPWRASPTGADGRIYCFSEAGEVVVLAAGDAFKVLARVALDERPCHSTIAVAGGRLFIRTAGRLYCVGKK